MGSAVTPSPARARPAGRTIPRARRRGARGPPARGGRRSPSRRASAAGGRGTRPEARHATPARSLPPSSSCRRDVLVEAEQVVRVVPPLDLPEERPRLARIRRAHALRTLVADEVDVRGVIGAERLRETVDPGVVRRRLVTAP